jgi:hypothetical protein
MCRANRYRVVRREVNNRGQVISWSQQPCRDLIAAGGGATQAIARRV